jgi:hypothetical protein
LEIHIEEASQRENELVLAGDWHHSRDQSIIDPRNSIQLLQVLKNGAKSLQTP